MSWIDEVLDAYHESEAPEKFFYWSALSALSAVVRKNVYIDLQHYILRPNIYVFLIADSGTKKGIPVNLAKDLVKRTNATRIISGRNSMPAIMKDLGKLHTIENGRSIKEAHAFMVSGELSSFLVRDPDALNILTDLYNCHENEDEWKNTLKGSGVDKLLAPCLTVFGASNEDLLEDIITQKDIKGGFIARTFIVTVGERGKPNSLMDKMNVLPDKAGLSEYLKSLIPIKGEMSITPEGKAYYKSWYDKMFYDNVTDKTHTKGRLGDKVLKVAMLLSLADSHDLVITMDHLVEAISETEMTWISARKIMLGSGKDAALSYKLKMVFRILLLQPDHKMSRVKVLQRCMGDINHFDLDLIVENLLAANVIKVEFPNTGRAIYELKETALKLFDSHVKEIN